MRVSILCTAAQLALAVLLSGCSPSADSRSDERGSEAAPAVQATSEAATAPPIVVFQTAGKPRAAVLVEIAQTPQAIQQGLMYRREMDENHGMLFLMAEERVQSFWMRNTYISLDMIFIDRTMTVVGVVENTTPLSDESRSVGKPSKYVVEVNAGWAAKNGVGPGTRVRFKNVDH